MSNPKTAILIGAGNRGADAYGPYAIDHPQNLEFIGVAEPDPVRRARFATAHDIAPHLQFESWEQVLQQPQQADAVFNMTQDQMHYASTVAALNAGYHVLLEKPMTNTLAETMHLIQLAEARGLHLQICHVLRYAPFFLMLKEILASGRLGTLINVDHRENVVYWHMAHSFVRGNWRNLGMSSPMILAKCCHDMDLLYWNVGQPVRRLQSFGSLRHYRQENAPPGAMLRCTDGCEVDCQYDARKIYLGREGRGWPNSAISSDPSPAGQLRALETGWYGRCVYHCDNDVVDNQTVNMEFTDGTTVTMTMHGHSYEEGRTMRYEGTRATLRGRFVYGKQRMEIHDHLTGTVEEIPIGSAKGGHGGGDSGIVDSFVQALNGDTSGTTSARESLESHLMCFAAEQSRLNGTVIDMALFRQQAEQLTRP